MSADVQPHTEPADDEERLVKLVADVISMHPCERDDGHKAHQCVAARAVIENLRRAAPLRLLAAGASEVGRTRALDAPSDLGATS